MITSSTRPMTATERSSLVKAGQKTGSLDGDFGFAFGVTIAVALLTLVVARVLRITLTPPREYTLAVLALLCGSALLVYRRRKSHVARVQDPILLDLAGGVLSVSVYSAQSAIQVEEFEDEGYNFFVRLSDDQVVYLSGQYLYDVTDSKQFPNTEFVITRTQHSDVVLDVTCNGTYLQPVNTLRAFAKDRVVSGQVPCDRDLISTPWEELLKRE